MYYHFQFFGVHIMSVSVMYLREKWPECLLHASAEKITLEGATLNQSNIAVSVTLLLKVIFNIDINFLLKSLSKNFF